MARVICNLANSFYYALLPYWKQWREKREIRKLQKEIGVLRKESMRLRAEAAYENERIEFFEQKARAAKHRTPYE